MCSQKYLDKEIPDWKFYWKWKLKSKLEKITKNAKIISRKALKKTIEKNFNVVKLPWIPKLEPKLKTRFRKFSIKTVLKSKWNLKNLLCLKKSNILPNSYPGVHKLTCSCNLLHYSELKKKYCRAPLNTRKIILKENRKVQVQLNTAWNSRTI